MQSEPLTSTAAPARPGTHTFRWEQVAMRPSGDMLQIGVHTYEGATAGPSLGLFSTSHGDEVFTVALIREVLDSLDLAKLRGRVVAVPLGNPIAFESFTRATGQGLNTDDTNLNRVFPGSPNGWLTHRMAHVITTRFLDGLDALIDFHCGNLETIIDYVLVERDDSPVGRQSFELSRLCATPLIYSTDIPESTGTLSQYARAQGIPTVVAQLGGCAAADPLFMARCVRGVRNVMVHLGMLDEEIEMPDRQRHYSGPRTLLRPAYGGLFMPAVGYDHLSTAVSGGTVLGRVVSPQTLEVLEELRAPYDESVLIMLRGVMSRVTAGDYAYIIANGASMEILGNEHTEAQR